MINHDIYCSAQLPKINEKVETRSHYIVKDWIHKRERGEKSHLTAPYNIKQKY